MIRFHPRAGFTLVEMAVVMVIIGLVMMAVLPALTSVRSASQRSLTQTNLHTLMLATAAYVQANGCLPCPADGAGVGSAFGTTDNGTICGACSKPEGIPPFVSLGIPATMAHDGWGHWITMRVDPALTSLPSRSSSFVPPAGLCTTTDVSNNVCTSAQIGTAAKGLCRTGISASNRISVTIPGGATQQAAVIFVSHGVNGYGSFFAQAVNVSSNGATLPFSSEYASCAASGYAQCNAAGTTQFYDAPAVIGASNPYDDILAYADRNALVSLLGNGSCQTAW